MGGQKRQLNSKKHCFCIRSGFYSQYSHGSSEQSVTPVPGALMFPSGLMGTRHARG